MTDLATRDPAQLDDPELARWITTCGHCPAREAEAEFCRRYVRRLSAFGRRRLGSVDAGLDLAQDSLILTLQKLRAGEVREPDKIGSFLFGVARSLVGSQLRRRKPMEPFDDEAERRLVVESFELPDPFARDRVAGCLEKMPERQRTILLMSFYGERSADEIAASLGLSDGNVRVIRHRSVARLRDCLGVDLGVDLGTDSSSGDSRP